MVWRDNPAAMSRSSRSRMGMMRGGMGGAPSSGCGSCYFPQDARSPAHASRRGNPLRRQDLSLSSWHSAMSPLTSPQAVMQGDGGNHRIDGADGLADAFQLAGDAAGQYGGIPV